MRNTSKPSILPFFLFFFLLILLTSCENFMQGGEVADSITDHINYMNSPVFSVRIAPEEIEHGIVVSGISKEKVRVNDEFEIIFSKNADYTFLGWDAVKKDDHNISYNQYVKFEQTSALSTTVKIIGGNEDIYNGQLQLRPLCRPVSRGKINITSSYGTVSYNCEDEYKEGTPLKLSISPNPGYGFTHWIVMVGDEYDESGEYVVIDDFKNPITDATFLKCPEDENEIIYIIPECIDRPVIISNTPYGSDSFSSDSRIKVLFDSPMDEDSLYYTSPELITLGSGITKLYSTLKPGKIYGYEKDGKQYYKNIIVTDRDTNKSLLEYFGEPRFTTPDMLVIPTDSSKPLPKNTEIIVNISSNFSTKTEAGYSVSLDGKKIWNYMVNGESDKVKPAWSDSYPKVEAVDGVFKKRDGTAYTEYNWNGVWSALTGDTTNKYSSAVSNNTYFVRNNKLKINAEFSDTGTGPSSLTLYLQRVNSSSYTDITTKNLPIRITGNKAFYQKNGEGVEVDLTGPNNQKLPDGAYRVWLRAEDDAGNHEDSKYFYVYLDTTNTKTSKPASATATENSITFNDIPNASSSNYLLYQMKKAGEEYSTPIRITDTSKTINSLAAGTSYKFKFFLCDDFGNSNYNVEFTKNTQPSKPLNVTMAKDESNQTKINISLKKNSDPNYKGASVTINQFNPETGNTNSSQQISSGTKTITIPLEENKDTYTGSFTSLQPGYRYVITASAYDSGDDYSSTNVNVSEGETAKVSSGSATSLVLNPAPLTNLAVNESSTGNGKVKVSWNLPAQSFINAYNLYYKDAANSSASWTTSPIQIYGQNKNNEEVILPDAATGKKLKFKLESAVVNSTNHSTEYAKSSSAPEYEYFVPPKNLVSFTMESKTNTSVTFKWTNPNTTYDGIKIGYKASSASSYTYFDVDKTKTSYTIQNLSSSTQYYFSYYTYTNNGNSTVKSITTSAASVTTRPNPVTNLKATPLSGSQIKLTWTKPTGTYTGIKLYKKVNTASNYTELRTIASNTSTEYTWTLSNADSAYVYDVVAVSYYSDTNNTSAETAITANSSIDPVTNFKVSSTTKNSITVSWTNPATAYDSLILSYTKAGGTTVTETLSSKTLTSKTISSLSAGSSYNIKLQTKVTKNSQAYTQDVSLNQYTRPNAVTNITVERNSTYPNSQLDISWTKPSETSGVCIFYSTGTDLSKAKFAGDTVYTDYTITGLTGGTNYNVWVVAYAGTVPDSSDITKGTSFNTTEAASVSCYTSPYSPAGLSCISKTQTSVSLSWTKPSTGSVTGYRVYKKDITAGASSYTYVNYTTSTSYNVSVTAGHKYSFKVTSYLDTTSNESTPGATIECYAKAPTCNFVVSPDTNAPNTTQILSWTWPESGRSDMWLYIYKGTSSTFTNSTLVASKSKDDGTSLSYSSLSANTNYYWWIVTYVGDKLNDPNPSTINGKTDAYIGSSKSKKTAPNAPTGLKLWMDDGMGRVKFTWTKPASCDSLKLVIGSTSYTFTGSDSGWIDISNYSRSSSYSISLKAYNSEDLASLAATMTYSNPSGNLVIEGTQYSYSACNNVCTSATSVTKSSSYKWTGSGDERHYSSFSNNSENGGSGSVSIPTFSMGAYEVNRKLFKAVIGSDPSNFNDGYTQEQKNVRPVENLNVYQAMLFCNKLSTLFGYTPYYKVIVSNSYETDWSFSTSDSSYSGFEINAPSSLGFRLPSKEMWEFAARGGNPNDTTNWNSYYSGAKSTYNDAQYRNRVAWNNSNANPSKPNYVYWAGTYAPNLKGLYNMSGNVWEMTDTIYSKNTTEVVSMGGSFENDTRCAVDSIFTQTKAAENNKVGFRMCRNKTVDP